MADNDPDAGKRRFLLTASTVATAAAAGAAARCPSREHAAFRARESRGRRRGRRESAREGRDDRRGRGKPVWVVRRRPRCEEVRRTRRRSATLAAGKARAGVCEERCERAQARDLVVVGICTHLGCSPSIAGRDAEPFASTGMALLLPVPVRSRSRRPRHKNQTAPDNRRPSKG